MYIITILYPMKGRVDMQIVALLIIRQLNHNNNTRGLRSTVMWSPYFAGACPQQVTVILANT